MKIDNILQLLFEQAFSRNKVENKIDQLVDTTIKHLFKILLFGDVSTWSKELQNYIDKIADLRTKNNKVLKKEDYYRILFTEYLEESKNKPNLDIFFKWLNDLKNEYLNHQIKKEINEENINNYFYIKSKLFFEKIADTISRKKYPIIQDILKEL